MRRGVSATATDRWPPRTGEAAAVARPSLWGEFLIGLVTFGVYSVVARLHWASREAAARAHGRALLRLEQHLHIDIERSFNTWLLHHDAIRAIANYEYAFTYIVSAFLLLGWLYRRRPDLYRSARTSFVALNVFAIGCFAFYPVTPPRLLPSLGFVDTVRRSHTFGSWGPPAVDQANQLAAMPSLHLGWALWVSVMLGIVAGSWQTQTLSLVHVVVTFFVIVSTANHYVLDAVGGGIVVMLSLPIAGLLRRRRTAGPARPARVAATDLFFLHVESPTSAQNVGGLMVLDVPGGSRDAGNEALVRADVERLMHRQIDAIPRFRQRLSPASRWRRPRWLDAGPIDWAWHVAEHDLRTESGRPAGLPALQAYAARLLATPLPRDRPLWRLIAVHGVSDRQTAVIFLTQHVIADGFGTVANALRLLEPSTEPDRSGFGPGPSVLARLAATTTGLAQLAVGGRPERRPVPDTQERGLALVDLPLDEVRATARALEVHMTDLVLCLVAGALARTHTGQPPQPDSPTTLRASVTLLVPQRGGSGIGGNATGAAMIDLPVGPLPDIDRLRTIARMSGRLRSGTRALASHFVMNAVGEALPPPVHAWFARTVYSGRFFHAIVSNIPGPPIQFNLLGLPLSAGYPLLPLAPGVPLAIGALGLGPRFTIGVSTHPALVDDDAAFASAAESVYDGLRRAALDVEVPSRAARSLEPVGSAAQGVQTSARVMRSRASGSSRSLPNSSRSRLSR